jgi:uncharacterized protein YdbL (DUF1318 family)
MTNNILVKLSFTLIAMFFSVAMAWAGVSLDSAKQQGLVGEKPDGLLGAVSAPSPDVEALVENTNAERLNKYQGIAAKNGTALDQVQALAGKTLMDRTPAGQYIMNAGGGWQKK